MILSRRGFAFFLLSSFLLIYGFRLEPTPDSPTPALLVFLTLASILTMVCARAIRGVRNDLAICVGIILVGILGSLPQNSAPVQLVRDIISFAFLPFSIVVLSYALGNLLRLDKLKLLFAVTGVLFSLRYASDAPRGLESIISSSFRLDTKYLSSEPLVMFGLLFFLQLAFSYERGWVRFGALAMSAFAASGLLAAGYRGPIVVWALMFVVFAAHSAVRGGLWTRAFSLFLVGGSAYVVIRFGFFEQVSQKIINKTALVGTNGKLNELFHVIGLDRTLFESLFGVGFGGKFPSPIFAGLEVAYTHNVFTYFYMKFGLLGLALFLLLIWRSIGAYLLRKPVLIFSHIPELLTLLYVGLGQAAHKHFGFSLLLGLLIVVLGKEYRSAQIQQNSAVLVKHMANGT